MLQPDTLLKDRYLIRRHVSQGAMGCVYEAVDQSVDLSVAVKEMRLDFEGRPGACEQFEAEARALMALDHPAVVKVTDYFVEDAGRFLVMPFIPGKDLAELLLSRPHGFSLQDVLRVGDQLLDALEYLHAQDRPVVHCDIKPANLKLAESDRVVLLDFGLAKRAPFTPVDGSYQFFFHGYTWHYAAREQVLRETVDARADLYALGASLYHLLTGQPPPDALHRIDALGRGRDDPLDLASGTNRYVPGDVASFLRRAMALDREERFASARAMHEALRELAQVHSPPPPGELVADEEPPTGAVRLFLSTVTPRHREQARFIQQLMRRLRAMGIDVVRLSPDLFDSDDPLTQARRQIASCHGLIALGLERLDAELLRREGGAASRRKHTSAWLHMEAAIAHALGREVFVLCQHDLWSDGIFDRDWNTYEVTELTTLDGNSEELTAFLERIALWAKQRALEKAT